MELDALIIGGGPAGSTTALLLAEAGWSVGLIEKKTFPRKKVCGEFLSATNLPLLQKLGLADYYLAMGGPEVHRVGLYAGKTLLTAKMPPAYTSLGQWGRAIGREYLDSEILNRAIMAGVQLFQPAEANEIRREGIRFVCSVKEEHKTTQIIASVIVVAQGSWEKRIVGSEDRVHKTSDLLAFKAHFSQANLPNDLMPLLAFPGGYGGLVNTNNERVTLSCCIRRDMLENLRAKSPGLQAGEAVFEYLLEQCFGVRTALFSAKREGNWLATGPIRPGIRHCYNDGLFFAGNIAGEAHPVVAEGISMAIQSAWLLSHSLIAHRNNLLLGKSLKEIGTLYTKQWHKHFAKRIHAASFFASLAMMPKMHALVLPILTQFPELLTLGAKLSGKNKYVEQ
jgi:flavin-dependent dehydrogenase